MKKSDTGAVYLAGLCPLLFGSDQDFSVILVITMGKTQEETVSGLLEVAIVVATGSITASTGRLARFRKYQYAEV